MTEPMFRTSEKSVVTPEREAEIRRWLGPGPYATGGAEMIVADLLAAYDSERVARGRAEHAWANERDAMKAQRDTAQAAWADAVNSGAAAVRELGGLRAMLATRIALRREVEALLGVDSEDATDEQFERGVAALRAVMDGSALREARAEAAECRRRAGDAEERCGVLERMLANAPNITGRERLTRELGDKEAQRAQAQYWAEAFKRIAGDAEARAEKAEGERDEARAELASLRADVDADACGRLALRRRHGAKDHETWPEFIARLAGRTLAEHKEREEARHASRSAKGVPASEIAASQVPSQPGVIAKLTAPSLEERVAALEDAVQGLWPTCRPR